MKGRRSRAVTADQFNSILRDANWFVINHVKSENMISRTRFVMYRYSASVSAYVFVEYRLLILQNRHSKAWPATWVLLQLIT